jgi:hypothetical protein
MQDTAVQLGIRFETKTKLLAIANTRGACNFRHAEYLGYPFLSILKFSDADTKT